MMVRIKRIDVISPSIKHFVFEPAAGLFPTAGAGAHVIVSIPGPGRVWRNAYSLVSSPENHAEYEIIVRRVAASRGGSAWLHDHAVPGDALEISLPQIFSPLPVRPKNICCSPRASASRRFSLTSKCYQAPMSCTIAASKRMSLPSRHCCRHSPPSRCIPGAIRSTCPPYWVRRNSARISISAARPSSWSLSSPPRSISAGRRPNYIKKVLAVPAVASRLQCISNAPG